MGSALRPRVGREGAERNRCVESEHGRVPEAEELRRLIDYRAHEDFIDGPDRRDEAPGRGRGVVRQGTL